MLGCHPWERESYEQGFEFVVASCVSCCGTCLSDTFLFWLRSCSCLGFSDFCCFLYHCLLCKANSITKFLPTMVITVMYGFPAPLVIITPCSQSFWYGKDFFAPPTFVLASHAFFVICLWALVFGLLSRHSVALIALCRGVLFLYFVLGSAGQFV